MSDSVKARIAEKNSPPVVTATRWFPYEEEVEQGKFPTDSESYH